MSENHWTEEKIPDQLGRIAIVTGASSGIGYETARALAEKNATVIMAVRNTEKGNKAANKIRGFNSKADVRVMQLELADLKSVRAFSDAFKAKFPYLDLLINNAGVMIPPYTTTPDGFELQMGTNHLGHFALSGYLIDLMKKTTESRIVNVSSNAHKIGKLNFEDLHWKHRRYRPARAYGDSKIANLYFTLELARKIKKKDKNPLITAVHPGWTATELQRHSIFFSFMNHIFAQDQRMGALPTLYAATGPDVTSGDYIGPSGLMEMRGYPKKTQTSKLAKNEKIAARLWSISEELTEVKFELN